MKRNAIFLALGVLIGLIIGRVISPTEHDEARKVSNKEEVTTDSVVTSAPQPKSKTFRITASENKIAQKPLQKVIDKPSTNSNPEIKEKLTIESDRNESLILSEQIVRELEYEWDHLRSQVQLRQEDRGWRVSYIAESSTFGKTGIKTGDLITYRSMNKLKEQDSTTNNLGSRVIRILYRVQ